MRIGAARTSLYVSEQAHDLTRRYRVMQSSHVCVPPPAQCSIDGRPRYREDLWKIAGRIFPGVVHSPELFLLFFRQFWPFPTQLSLRLCDHHALAGAHLDEVCFEFGEGGNDVEELFPHCVSGIMDCRAGREFHDFFCSFSALVRTSGTERAGRPSFETTKVSPSRRAASAWSRPGRFRFVRVNPWSVWMWFS